MAFISLSCICYPRSPIWDFWTLSATSALQVLLNLEKQGQASCFVLLSLVITTCILIGMSTNERNLMEFGTVSSAGWLTSPDNESYCTPLRFRGYAEHDWRSFCLLKADRINSTRQPYGCHAKGLLVHIYLLSSHSYYHHDQRHGSYPHPVQSLYIALLQYIHHSFLKNSTISSVRRFLLCTLKVFC